MGQVTINRRMMFGLTGVRNAGSIMKMKKGDWPTVPETDVAIYSPEQLTVTYLWISFKQFVIPEGIELHTTRPMRHEGFSNWKAFDDVRSGALNSVGT